MSFSRREILLASAAIGVPSPLRGRSGWQKDTSFLVVGDWGRSGGDYQRHVAREMELEAYRLNADFIVSTGDNFYLKGVTSIRDSKWEASFDDIYTHASLQKPWYPVLGNHDYGGNVWAQLERSTVCPRWQMPARWYKRSYARDNRPHLDLFFIDTIAWTGAESFPFNLVGSTVSKADQRAQKDWLTDELLASKAPLKIVFGHYPIFSVGEHGGAKRLDDLDRLLRKAGVTAYINGHDHCLYHIRSSVMDYIGTGGGSQEKHKYTGDPAIHGCVVRGRCISSDPLDPLPQWIAYLDRAGFASLVVDATFVQFALIDRNGIVIHQRRLGVRKPDPSVVLL